MKKKPVKKKTYKKRTTTSRQIKAKANMVENGSTQGKALKDAGYSDNYANQPGKFADTKAGQDLIKTCNDLRDKSLEHALDNLEKASYGDSIRGADTLNKIARLEGGESTEIVTNKINELTGSLKDIARSK